MRVAGVHARYMTSDSLPGEDRRLAQDRGWGRWALRRWESFPISQQPRPLVMSGPLTRFRARIPVGRSQARLPLRRY
jgi:hypothetical protein